MIPDYQTLMLPLLNFISDAKTYNIQDTVTQLGREFHLSEAELNEWLPSKKQKTFHNRVHWAKSHLKMAGVIENVSRGMFRLSMRGKELLKENQLQSM